MQRADLLLQPHLLRALLGVLAHALRERRLSIAWLEEVEAVSRLLQHRGLPTILQLNDAQQLVVQTWVTISCFSLYQDFSRLPDGRAGWERILRRAVDDLADAPRWIARRHSRSSARPMRRGRDGERRHGR